MHTIIALFRGINVGGKHILPMKELAGILEGLGYVDIRTYIQSGNVVMRGRKKPDATSGDAIGEAVLAAKGFKPEVMLLSAEALQDVIAACPFPTNAGKALHFYFLESSPPRPDMAHLASLKSATEDFGLAGKVFYLYAPDGIGRSKLAVSVEKSLGVPATARNANTVGKLVEMTDLA